MLERAEGAGELTLTTSDPSIQPNIHCRYLEHDRDRSRLREAVRIGLSLLDHKSFENIVESLISPTEEDLKSDDALPSLE